MDGKTGINNKSHILALGEKKMCCDVKKILFIQVGLILCNQLYFKWEILYKTHRPSSAFNLHPPEGSSLDWEDLSTFVGLGLFVSVLLPSFFHPSIPSHPLCCCQLVNVSENLSSLSSQWPTIKMMSELGVLKPYPFTHLGDHVPALEAVEWCLNSIRCVEAVVQHERIFPIALWVVELSWECVHYLYKVAPYNQ